MFRNIKRGKPHAEVDEDTESHQGRQLGQSAPVETAPQNHCLQCQKQQVQSDGSHSESYRDNECHYVWQAGYGGGAQPRAGAEGDSETGQNQADKKYNEAFSFTESVFHTITPL